MKKSRLFSILFLATLAFLLVACTGTPQNVSWPGITADDNMVYLANGAAVYGVRIKDGTEAWRYPLKAENGKTFYASPVLTEDGQLLVGSYSVNPSNLFSLDPQNGTVKWTFSDAKGRYVSSPLAAAGIIYAPANDNKLYALNLQGTVQWQFTANQELWAAPVTDGTRIYLASMDHHLYALNTKNNTKLWVVDLGNAMVSSPVITPDGVVITGTLGNEIVAVQADNGKILWRTPTDNGVWGTPVIKDNFLYFADATGNIFSVDTTNGKVAWKIKPGDPIIGSPALTPDGLVFPIETGTVVAVDFKGNILWTKTVTGKLYSNLVYQNDKLLIAVKDGVNGLLLVAMDKNGSQLWTYTPAK
jgi:outer membrane protein assembly factor BamB